MNASAGVVFQHDLSLDERQYTQILSVEVEQVKRDEDALPLTKQQIAEVRPTGPRAQNTVP